MEIWIYEISSRYGWKKYGVCGQFLKLKINVFEENYIF